MEPPPDGAQLAFLKSNCGQLRFTAARHGIMDCEQRTGALAGVVRIWGAQLQNSVEHPVWLLVGSLDDPGYPAGKAGTTHCSNDFVYGYVAQIIRIRPSQLEYDFQNSGAGIAGWVVAGNVVLVHEVL